MTKLCTYVCLLVFLTTLGVLGDNVWCFALGIAGFGLVPMFPATYRKGE